MNPYLRKSLHIRKQRGSW